MTDRTRMSATAPASPPPPVEQGATRGVRLRTSENVRAELARVYRSYRQGCGPGPLDATQARTAGFLLQTLAAVIRDEKLGEIEEQLEELKRAGVLK